MKSACRLPALKRRLARQALKEAFLKTDADLRTEAGHAECLRIRKEVTAALASPRRI